MCSHALFIAVPPVMQSRLSVSFVAARPSTAPPLSAEQVALPVGSLQAAVEAAAEAANGVLHFTKTVIRSGNSPTH